MHQNFILDPYTLTYIEKEEPVVIATHDLDPVNEDYDLISILQLQTNIKNDLISINQIINIIKKQLNNNDFKKLLFEGIKSYSNKNNNYKCLNNINNELKKLIETSNIQKNDNFTIDNNQANKKFIIF